MGNRTILHVIESRGPGGAETILVELVARGARRSIASIPSHEGWLARALPRESQRTVPPTPSDRSGLVDLPYARALRALIHAERPALVHAHSFDTALYTALATRRTGVPFIATFHGAKDVIRSGLRSRLKWLLIGRAGALVCVSQSLAELASSVPGFPARRLRAILNGANLAPFTGRSNRDLRERLGIADSTVLIGALGNVRGPKGYPVLLEAIALLRASGIDVHLTIAGDDRGALADELRAKRATLGLDAHVSFLSFVDDPAPYLEGLDLFVLSSTSEGFSLSTVQAMAAARPIVATRSGGPEELLRDGETGLLVPTDSPQVLAEALARLAHDADLGARLGAAARLRALDTFSVEAMVRQYEGLYDELARP